MNSVGFYVPCFNAERTLAGCLTSILGQTLKPREIVVVDDGSTDATARVALRYPVRLVRHGHNRGLAAARNTALRSLGTEFVASVDADCVCEKDWLERLTALLASGDLAGAGGKVDESQASAPADLWRAVHMAQTWGEAGCAPPFLYGSNTVFRRAALEKVGFYDERFRANYEDVDIGRRLKNSGYGLSYEPRALVRHARQDDLFSVLDSHWKWQRDYFEEQAFYGSPEKFLAKIRDNVWTANRFVEEDVSFRDGVLLYADLLFVLHHSFRDMLCYERVCRGDAATGVSEDASVSLWLAFFDLVFFDRWHRPSDPPRTWVRSGEGAVFQNAVVLLFRVMRYLTARFPSVGLRRRIVRDWVRSLLGHDDPPLEERVFFAGERPSERSGFCGQRFPLLQDDVIEVFDAEFQKSWDNLLPRFQDLGRRIEDSGKMFRGEDIPVKEGL